ncbi:MAG: peptide ABC transporter substrate-binding protein, partial [Clostridia bacterium]|nr:peptide ABC transporter substrate-binding protein [Clostridia bacterium]
MKKLISLLLAVLLLAGLVPALAEENVYTALYSGEVGTLNYLVTSTTNEYAVCANLIDTLVEYDRYGRVQPSLAERWETSEDGLVWTFYLRQDALWVDADLNVVAPVTANDFVSAARYILTAENASATAKNLYDIIVGAKAYYDGETQDFDTVGVKAVDDYTLEYTLKWATPYFLSMVDYVCFMPVYGPFLEEKGADFGKASGNDNLLYCGAYVLSELAPQERRVLTKNTTNWDADNVLIEKLVFIFNKEASTIGPEMYLRGEIDSASIDTTIANEWLADPEKADYIRPSRPSSFFSYFYSFNFDPQFDEEYEPDNWSKAVINENFRKSIYYGMDRLKARMVTDADNAEALLFNSITPTNFVNIDGVDYVNMGALAEITALGTGTFQAEKALEYRDLAIAELTEAGVTFPIKIMMPYNPEDTGVVEEYQVIEQQLEALLGTDYIDIILYAGPSSGFLNATRRCGNYAFMKTNWGPDYDDPQTFTEPFWADNNYQYLDKNADMADTFAELTALIEAAIATTTDMEARYLAFAEVEAYLVNHAIVVPYGFRVGGYTASRIDPIWYRGLPARFTNRRSSHTRLR